MARSDLLLNLVKASVEGDGNMVRSTVHAIAAEERSKQHNVLADQLLTTLARSRPGAIPSRSSEPQERQREFVQEINPARRVDELILPDVVVTAVGELIEEQRRSDLLRSHGLEPRHKVLLVGAPGNGKTTLAEGIAEALALPMFVVRYDAIIGSFLGETASRLRRVFDYARTTPCVLFFDEFDSIGKERGDIHETGEIKRVVSSLLMLIDTLPSYVVVIAATNHSELLDRAAWRRFQLRVSLPQPSKAQLASFVESTLLSYLPESRISGAGIASKLGNVSFAEAEEFCLNVARRLVLGQTDEGIDSMIRKQVELWQIRTTAANANKEGSRSGRTTNSPHSNRGKNRT